jgi:hypothetical protein
VQEPPPRCCPDGPPHGRTLRVQIPATSQSPGQSPAGN